MHRIKSILFYNKIVITPINCYNIYMKARKNNGKNQGLAPKDRKRGAVANQWTASPRQELFIALYINPNSSTFGNAYKSAIQAGYKHGTAIKIASPSIANKWIVDYSRKSSLTIDHLKESIADIIRGNIDSKDYTLTKLKAIELLAKLDGHMIERKQIASVVKVELGQANQIINTD